MAWVLALMPDLKWKLFNLMMIDMLNKKPVIFTHGIVIAFVFFIAFTAYSVAQTIHTSEIDSPDQFIVSTGSFNQLVKFSVGECNIETRIDIAAELYESSIGEVFDGLMFHLGSFQYFTGSVKFQFLAMINDYSDEELLDLSIRLSGGKQLLAAKTTDNGLFANFANHEDNSFIRWEFIRLENIIFIINGSGDNRYAVDLIQNDITRMINFTEVLHCDAH